MSDFYDIDELDVLRSQRLPVIELDPESDLRIRRMIEARLREQAVADSLARPPELTIIEPVPDPAGDDLDDDVLELVPSPPGADRRPRPRSRRVRVLAAAAALIVLVGGAIAIGRNRTTDTIQVADDQRLDALEAVVGAQPDVQLGPGDAQRTKGDYVQSSRVLSPGGGPDRVAVTTKTVEAVIAADGSGEERTTNQVDELRGEPSVPPTTVPDRTQVIAAGARSFADFTYDDVRALPTDAVGLRAVLVRRGNGTQPEMLQRIAGLLTQPVTPPAVKRALIEVLRGEGLRSVGPTTDRVGRAGEAFELVQSDGTSTWSFVFDEGGRLLQWATRDPASGAPQSSAVLLDLEASPIVRR